MILDKIDLTKTQEVLDYYYNIEDNGERLLFLDSLGKQIDALPEEERISIMKTYRPYLERIIKDTDKLLDDER